MTVDRIVACRRGRALIAVRVAVGARGVWSGRAVAAKIAAVTEAIPSKLPDASRVFKLLGEVKALAREYYELTGRPLGITGEIAEYEAGRLLDVTLAPVRQQGYDAVRTSADGGVEKLQIKGRCLLPGAKPGQRIGSIRLDRDWDAVLLVTLDEHYEAEEIHEAARPAIKKRSRRPVQRRATSGVSCR